MPDPLDDFGIGSPSYLPSHAAALIYQAQNDATFTGQSKPLQLALNLGTTNNVPTVNVNVTLSSLTSTHIELYHEGELLTVFTQGSGTAPIYLRADRKRPAHIYCGCSIRVERADVVHVELCHAGRRPSRDTGADRMRTCGHGSFRNASIAMPVACVLLSAEPDRPAERRFRWSCRLHRQLLNAGASLAAARKSIRMPESTAK